jgi:hypothetical protein
MSNRFKTAYDIQNGGACNIRAITRELVKAIEEADNDGVQPREDAAVRLIVHQMASLCEVTVFVDFAWDNMMEECKRKGGD